MKIRHLLSLSLTWFFLGCIFPLEAQVFLSANGGANIGWQQQDNFGKSLKPDVFAKQDLMLEFAILPRISVLIELGYNIKGSAYRNVTFTDENGTILANNGKIKFNYHYLELSTLGKINLFNLKGKRGETMWFGLAGFSTGYLARGMQRSSEKWKLGEIGIPRKFRIPLLEYNRYDLGVNVGTGLEHKIGARGKFQLIARYQHGLNNQILPSIFGTFKRFSRSLFLTVGYGYQIL